MTNISPNVRALQNKEKERGKPGNYTSVDLLDSSITVLQSVFYKNKNMTGHKTKRKWANNIDTKF